jgi:uncharacterized protein YoxC
MSFFKNLFGKVTDLKASTEQKELTAKINDLYESIAKGVEELNAKVNSVKELKEKLKNLPPPPPPPPQETPNEVTDSSEEEKNKKQKEEELIRKQKEEELIRKQKEEELIRKQKEEDKNKVAAPAAAPPAAPAAPVLGDNPLGAPARDSSSSPLPMPGAPQDIPSTPNNDFEDYGGGKKRKPRAKGKRSTISKNKNETNTGKRTRKNRNRNKEPLPESNDVETKTT